MAYTAHKCINGRGCSLEVVALVLLKGV